MTRLFPYDATSASLFTPCRGPFFDGWKPRSEGALCAELSRLAYCPRDEIVSVLAQIEMRHLALIAEADDRGTLAFLAADDERAVLSFRGTRSHDRQNVADDASFLFTSWTVGGESVGRVHRGFAKALSRVWPYVEEVVAGLTVPLLVTGHSLGGALAVLASSRLSCRRLITIGSPRVGDARFRRFLTARVEATRYQGCCDFVCRLPPPPVARHCGTQHYIDRNGKIHQSPGRRFVLTDQALGQLRYLRSHAWRKGNLLTRGLADHSPINYVSALAAAPENR